MLAHISTQLCLKLRSECSKRSELVDYDILVNILRVFPGYSVPSSFLDSYD